MPSLIEDYALIGDTQTAALVSRRGSIDWLCVPRFDSGACFAALLGEPRHGRWSIGPDLPDGDVRAVRRRYRGDTLVLETEVETTCGTFRLVDCMPPRRGNPHVIRLVEGVSGRVPLRMELVLRCDYGSIVPWVQQRAGRLGAIAGPDAFVLDSGVPTRGEELTTVARFEVTPGRRVPFVLAWHRSCDPQPPPALDDTEPAGVAASAIEETARWWQEWSSRCSFRGSGPYREAVVRSLITLKALTYAPTGGIIAAPTTSLPERAGGARNWDYRYCWLRDATFTLYSLLLAGYREEAAAWRDWLMRAVAGEPSRLQILYGIGGERRIPEVELDWLPGYQGARPVRVGNAAVGQRQLDVYGELADMMFLERRHAGHARPTTWRLEAALVEFLENGWSQPDHGIWEMRGPPRHFTHSKVMAWVAFDRAVRTVERFALPAEPSTVARWRALRAQIHDEVCRRGFDRQRGSFVQYFGATTVDASLLRIPLVGFLPPGDRRVTGTVAAVERDLMVRGLLRRYRTEQSAEVDPLPRGEGAFLACSFWLADCYAITGRIGEARALFERLLALRNDVGLLAEEYDPVAGRQLGNTPQALSHVALLNSAFNLEHSTAPAEHRRDPH